MAANTLPIYSRLGDIQGVTTGLNANTALDGTGTVATVFISDVTNGGRVERLRLVHMGSNVQTVVRFFINNGLTNATPANNFLFWETTMLLNTLSQTAASVMQEISTVLALPSGYKINVTIGTAIAAGIMVTAIGGKY